MKYLNKEPFSSRPATPDFRKGYDLAFSKLQNDPAEEEEPDPELVKVAESIQVVQFTKPEHEDKCNCRLCRTARRAEGK